MIRIFEPGIGKKDMFRKEGIMFSCFCSMPMLNCFSFTPSLSPTSPLLPLFLSLFLSLVSAQQQVSYISC